MTAEQLRPLPAHRRGAQVATGQRLPQLNVEGVESRVARRLLDG